MKSWSIFVAFLEKINFTYLFHDIFTQEEKKPVFGTPKFFNQGLKTDHEDFGEFVVDLKTVPVQVTPPNGMKKRFVNIEYNDPLAELFKVKI